MKFKAIVFDFNDVLSPSNFMNVFYQFESQLGMTANELTTTYINAGLLDRLMIGEFSTEHDFWIAVSELTGIELQMLLSIKEEIVQSKALDEMVLDLVWKLKSKYKLALLTNNYRETFAFWIEKFKLSSMFDVIVNSADYGHIKPSPEIYWITLRLLEVSPKETIMIDDNLDNLITARNLGMETVEFQGAENLERQLSMKGITLAE